MKNFFVFLLILLLPVISCKKESDFEAAHKLSGNYAGTFKLCIDDGLVDHYGLITMEIVATGHAGK